MKAAISLLGLGAVLPVAGVLFFGAQLLLSATLRPSPYVYGVVSLLGMALTLLYCFRVGRWASRRPSGWNKVLFLAVPLLFALLECFTPLEEGGLAGFFLCGLDALLSFPILYLSFPWPLVVYSFGPEAVCFLAFWIGEWRGP